jgi:hypothetical protein
VILDKTILIYKFQVVELEYSMDVLSNGIHLIMVGVKDMEELVVKKNVKYYQQNYKKDVNGDSVGFIIIITLQCNLEELNVQKF